MKRGSGGGTQGKKQMSCREVKEKKMKMKYKGTVIYGVVFVSRDLCPVINTLFLINDNENDLDRRPKMMASWSNTVLLLT